MSHPAKHAHVEDTLTRAEREAPFALGTGDGEPLPRPTRLALEWDGPRWAETDPATGYTLFVGCAPEAHDSAGRPAGRSHGQSGAGCAAVGGDA